jgi:hypothetical protein
MSVNDVVEAARALPEGERAKAAAEVTKSLNQDGQKEVAKGIDPGAWPQESHHRLYAIIVGVAGAILLLVGAGLFAVLPDESPEAVVTGMIAAGTAMIGGVWGATRIQ